MKFIRYSLLLAFVLAPALAMAQAPDSVNVLVDDIDDPLGGYGTSLFGVQFDINTDIGPLPIVPVEPFQGCDPITNPDDVAGNIAFISRGVCAFVLKVQNAVDAGAAAVIVYNDGRDLPPDGDGNDLVNMAGDCAPDVCSIPSVFISSNSGLLILDQSKFGATGTLDPIRVTAPPTPPPPATAGTHDTGALTLSVYDYGFIGANALFGVEGDGVPFSFGENEGALFVSSVLVGQGGVVNTNPYTQGNLEFAAINPVTAITPPAPFDQAFETSFSSEELGVTVTERSFSRSGDAFVIFEFDVTNTSGSALDDLYLGLFADWDIVDDEDDASTDDFGSWDADRSLAYVNDATATQYYGAAPLGISASGYNLDATTADDAQLFASMTTAIEPGEDAAERAAVTGVGPFNLADGATETVRFVYAAGASEADLFANVDAAANIAVSSEAVTPAGTYALESAFPNPFSAKTTIGFELPTAQDVRVTVYDVLGREVATLVDGTMAAGRQTVEFDAANLPSGVYIYRLEAGATQLTERVTVVR